MNIGRRASVYRLIAPKSGRPYRDSATDEGPQVRIPAFYGKKVADSSGERRVIYRAPETASLSSQVQRGNRSFGCEHPQSESIPCVPRQ